MIESIISFGKGILSAAAGSTLVKVQLGFMAFVITVMALITIAALICAVIVKINPGAKRKIFNFIEKI